MLLGLVVQRFLTGLRFEREALRQRFLSRGSTRAAFHASGKYPRVKEQLTIEVIIGLCGPVDSVDSVDLWTLWTL